MTGVTERLYASLCGLPRNDVAAQGAQLVHEVWSRAPGTRGGKTVTIEPGAHGHLLATDRLKGAVPVEVAAFNNTYRFVEDRCGTGFPEGEGADLLCLVPSVFAATALAEACSCECASLFHAVGLGMEAYVRLGHGLANGAGPRSFDARIIAASLAAIVACSAVGMLATDQAAQALGLGSSAVTGSTAGHAPLQLATAAGDAVAMVLLVSCGLRGPLDPLACRWGVYDVFANAADINALVLDSRRACAADELRAIFGLSASCGHAMPDAPESVPVAQFVASLR